MAINLLSIEEYIIQRVKEVAPDVNTEAGSAVRDILVTPMVTILQPLANEIHRIKKNQSLLNSASLSDDDVDAILANIFVDRIVGSKASGTAIVILKSPTTITIPRGTVLFAKGGLKFYTKSTQVLGPSTFTLNLVTGRYEVNVPVEAAEAGSSYNLNASEITGIVLSDTNIIGATNNTAFSGGLKRENSSALLDRARNSLGSRDLSTKRGAIDILKTAFDEIVNVNVVGMGDEDMLRDILYAPAVTIDGISYPESDGVHLGGKIDIYTQVGLSTYTADFPSGESSGLYGKNKVGFYTAESDENILYEGTGEGDNACSTTFKPLVNVKNVTIKDGHPDLVNSTITEERDFIFISNSPGLSNSIYDKKVLRFIKGTGKIEGLSLNHLYLDNFEGHYYPLNTYDAGVGIGTQDIRNPTLPLQLAGVSIEDLAANKVFDHGKGSTDGYSSIDFIPGAFQNQTTNGYTRTFHLKTGEGTALTTNLLKNPDGFTLAGWFNIRSLPATNERLTLFNAVAETGEASVRTILDIYIDDLGYIHYDTKNVGGSAQTATSNSAVLANAASIQNNEDNWTFLSFTYNNSLGKKAAYYANIFDLDLSTVGEWENLLPLDTGYIDIELFIGTHAPLLENAYKYTFDGLIDGLQLYYKPLTMTDLESMRKNQNTATIAGIENSNLGETLAKAIDEHNIDLVGGKIVVLTGAATGDQFNIVSCTTPFDPRTGALTSMTVVGTGSTPVTKLKDGDSWALTPYPIGETEITTDISGEIATRLHTTEDGEIKIGCGISMLYDSGLKIQEIQNYVDLNDTRPANADLMVKHVFPVYVGGTVNISTSSVITVPELTVEVNNYINGIAVGGRFSVAGLINFLFDVGIEGLRLPLDAITFTARDIRFKQTIITGVEDEFTLGKSQYFIPSSTFTVVIV